MFEVKQLSFAYNDHAVFNDLNFSINSGELCALFGPNGSGKSTLYRCILGHLRYQGHVTLNDVNLRTLSPSRVAQQIAYVPQQHANPFPFTVFDMVVMGRTPHLGGVFGPRREDLEVCEQVLDSVGLAAESRRLYHTLSGGQRQLVLIARALAQQSRLLLLDEPTASLDFGNQILVWNMIQNLSAGGVTILVCTHDPHHVLQFCNRVLVLGREGRFLADGRPAETVTAELVAALYPEVATYGKKIEPNGGVPNILNEETM